MLYTVDTDSLARSIGQGKQAAYRAEGRSGINIDMHKGSLIINSLLETKPSENVYCPFSTADLSVYLPHFLRVVVVSVV
jgi:hypothetical protein